ARQHGHGAAAYGDPARALFRAGCDRYLANPRQRDQQIAARIVCDSTWVARCIADIAQVESSAPAGEHRVRPGPPQVIGTHDAKLVAYEHAPVNIVETGLRERIERLVSQDQSLAVRRDRETSDVVNRQRSNRLEHALSYVDNG